MNESMLAGGADRFQREEQETSAKDSSASGDAPSGRPLPAEAPAGLENLESVLNQGLPRHPVGDFEDRYQSLADRFLAAKKVREEKESELFVRVDELVDSIDARLRQIEIQIRRLTHLRTGFDALGSFGAEGRSEVDAYLEQIRQHREGILALLSNPEVKEARARLEQRIGEERERLIEDLHYDSTRSEIEEVAARLLVACEDNDPQWVLRAMESFEADVREWRRFQHLPTIEGFWREIANRLTEIDPARAEAGYAKADELRREIENREHSKAVNEQAKELALRIREAVPALSELGPEETRVQMRIWLGQLRRYQDDYELDESTKKELYLSFGAINRARKDLAVQGFIDALNRNFRTDWEEYVHTWEQRLESARVQDQLDREEDERMELEREERERLSAEERARSDARLTEITEILEELTDEPIWRTDAETQEDVREMILAGLDEGGCQSEDFLGAARAFAPLVQGSEFRKLRRSLTKRGLDFEEITWIGSEEDEGPAEELCERLRPVWSGKRIAIVGGLPREQVRRRIESGLGLREARWYEYYRHHCDQEQAESAIRAGTVDLVVLLIRYAGHKINEIREVCRAAGVECRVIDRGCGVTSLLRGLEEV